jgi:hypothetical protein
LLPGGQNATSTDSSLRDTPVIVGAPGTDDGIVGSDGSGAFVVPTLLVADNVHV